MSLVFYPVTALSKDANDVVFMIVGTEQENKSVVQTIIDASTDPDKVLMFNYASEALNNSFFLENLVRLNAASYYLETVV